MEFKFKFTDRERFIRLLEADLSNIKVERKYMDIDGFINHLEEGGFFTSPCSTQYHLAEEGGLLKHSLNVESIIMDLHGAIDFSNKNINYFQASLVALLHDVGKMGQFGKRLYIENYLSDGVRSSRKPYITNFDLLNIDHEIRSINIITRFIDLTEEETFAILYHNGMYANSRYALKGHETPLQMLLHFADMWASRVTEKEE